MFVDYDYYKNTFKGADLTENEFSKYAAMACMQITASTLSRVNDKTINNYPPELVRNIKNCACAISELMKKFEDGFNILVNSSNQSGGDKSGGIIHSKTAGAVSVTYDTSAANKSIDYLTDPSKQRKIIQSVMDMYLSPICIGGKFYNLLSKVVGSSPACHHCTII